MNFKEALIAHLQGENVVCYAGRKWLGFMEAFGNIRINEMEAYGSGWQFRIAPRTITVNGVEVPAPEIMVPEKGTWVYVASPASKDMFHKSIWVGIEGNVDLLNMGIVYLNKEDAIARAKAMLITKES